MARLMDNTYSDYTVSGNTVTDGTGYEIGLAQINCPTETTFDTLYAHNDHLGTLHAQSNASGFTTFPVHTAFGGDQTSLGLRYSYVCAHGYQSNDNFDSLHVGARYYDPSSGRFLQRDPIGIRGGINVYAYVRNSPLTLIDPNGLNAIGDGFQSVGNIGMIAGGLAASIGLLLESTGIGAVAGAAAQTVGAVSFIAGGVSWLLGGVVNALWS